WVRILNVPFEGRVLEIGGFEVSVQGGVKPRFPTMFADLGSPASSPLRTAGRLVPFPILGSIGNRPPVRSLITEPGKCRASRANAPSCCLADGSGSETALWNARTGRRPARMRLDTPPRLIDISPK